MTPPATVQATPLAMPLMPELPITEDSVIVRLPGTGTLTVTLTPLSRSATAAAMAARNSASSAVAFSPVVAEARKSVSAELIAAVTAVFRSEPASLRPSVASSDATLMVLPLAFSRSVTRLCGT
ncbi:MAG: hypothetical protein U5N53_14100 [Mycobacterium sp.]|nr:hypothetical protein [Mycobacterium sp.]